MSTRESFGEAQRILIVEDEVLVAEDMSDILQSLGYQVVGIADNAPDALRLAAELLPDLILLDLHLKGAPDGVEVATSVHRELGVPVVFVTAYADPATLRRAGSAEPFGYVIKPFEERELQAAICVAMARHRAERRSLETEAWLSTTLGSIGDAVLATDLEGRITLLNVMAETLTGWTRSEAIGRPLQDVFAIQREGRPSSLEGLFERVRRTGVVFHFSGGQRRSQLAAGS